MAEVDAIHPSESPKVTQPAFGGRDGWRRPFRVELANEYVQHLTWRTRDRKPYFSDSRSADLCLGAFERERPRLRTEIFAYCLMPDHFHLIVGPSFLPLGTVVQWLKLASSYWLKESGVLSKSPWGRGYWDRAIRHERQLFAAVEYVHNNPVRAGIVEDPIDYPFSSVAAYSDFPTIIKVARL